ncbi:MAG: hypothetical protein IPQ15_18215 [Betaproteobacteria bacterium]|jgi:hypothetical protein|nr:hypothetical protein [Betaproteobacteria bacterium]
MTDSRHWYLVVAWAILAILGGVYAWVSQPIGGHPSMAGATIRGAVIVAWDTLAFAVVARNLERWDWTKLALGFCLGGGWVAPALIGASSAPMTLVSCGLILGSVSGLFSSVAKTLPRAALVGVGALAAQIAVDLALALTGLTRIRFGM